MRHVRVLLHKLEQLLLQLLVLAEGRFAVDVVPGNVVDIRQRHIFAAVDVGQATVVRLGVARDGVAGEFHDLPANVDDITAFGCTAGGLDVDTEHGALDGLAGVGHAERVAVTADLAHNGRGGALLHLADGGAGVGVGQAARERRGRHVAQARLANLVAQVAVAVGQVAHGGKVEAGVALGGKVLGLEHLEGLLALLALGLHGAVIAIDKHGDKRLALVFECLRNIHMLLLGRAASCGSGLLSCGEMIVYHGQLLAPRPGQLQYPS